MTIGNSVSAAIDAGAEIHPSAVLGEGTVVRGDVVIGADVRIGCNCVIEGSPEVRTVISEGVALEDYVRIYPGVSVGKGSRVGPFSILGHPSKSVLFGRDDALLIERVRPFLVVEPSTRIGSNALIRSHAVIYSNVVIGERFVTGHFVMIREHTTIGTECVFGTHASVDGYSLIRERSHIGQYAQLSQAVRIGRGAFVGGHTVFSDNRKVVRDISQDLQGATLEDYVRIGLNSTILPAVVVGRGALVGAGSLVTSDVSCGVLVYGSPARVSRQLSEQEIQEYVDSVGP